MFTNLVASFVHWSCSSIDRNHCSKRLKECYSFKEEIGYLTKLLNILIALYLLYYLELGS